MNRWIHRYAVLVAGATLFLIFVGGLVTSTDSGLSVPDWPLSYGRLMPPMVGGIFYEHGHRMVATGVGLLTVLLAILFWRAEPRRWMRRAAWIAVGLVVAQGVLGGLTVLFRLPKPISIAHACLAQTFFSLLVAIAVWTSSFWKDGGEARREPAGSVPLHQISATMFGVVYLQLLLGALLRHTGHGLIPHITGAVAALFLAGWLVRRVWRDHRDRPSLRWLAGFLGAAAVVQILIGITAYVLLGHEFDVIPVPFPAIAVITAHVAGGALVLGLSLIMALVSFRTRPEHGTAVRTKLSDYFTLTKPGISFMAGVTALAGFVMGSRGRVDLATLLHTCVGTLLIAGGAGTLNMLLEKDVDARMARTRSRPLPDGRMQPGEALLFGTALSAAALVYLGSTVNWLTALVAGITLSVYLYVYTPLKKISVLCTPAGAVAGALPPVIGWTAATGRLGAEAWILFGVLFFWQFPHFFSLAWLYKDDYARAGLRMLPVPEDQGATAAGSMVANSVALLAISLFPTIVGWTGPIYLFIAIALGLWMTAASVQFFFQRSHRHARRLFFASLFYVPALVVALVLNARFSAA